MLSSILGKNRKHKPAKTAQPTATAQSAAPEKSMALKIIHIGGVAECYYMATPAASIIDKYPSFILARPEVFRRPWDSIVRPEEILIPGQKYYVVPRQTVRKLRRRIRKTGGIVPGLSQSSFDASAEMISQHKGDDKLSSTISISSTKYTSMSSGKQKTNSAATPSILTKDKTKSKPRNLRVRFFGIDAKQDANAASSNISKDAQSQRLISQTEKLTRRAARNSYTWEPSFTSIDENNGVDE